MKLCGVPVLVLLLSMGTASGQQTQPLATQSTANLQAPSSRSSYDPMARGKASVQPKGIVETILAGINPQNKDYGPCYWQHLVRTYKRTQETGRSYGTA
jgi:hypothetical protein